MKDKKIMFFVSSTFLIFLTGCLIPEESSKIAILSGLAEKSVPPGDEIVATRFQQSDQQNPSAVETAIELSEKYVRLSEEVAILRQKNKLFLTEKQQANEKIATFDAQLQQTQKELNEANKLLIDLRIELNNWKTDILGFREEMRSADTEQLRALIKILEILGGEFKIEPTESKGNFKMSKTNVKKSEDIDSSIALLNTPNQLEAKVQETPTSGE